MGSNSSGKIFAQDDKFWDNYVKGRPRVPDAFFERIFEAFTRPRAEPLGLFTTSELEVGLTPGKLGSRFDHVIVSDVVAGNVELARRNNPGPGFTFRVAKVEDMDNLVPGSVDMVFATNVMHFPEPQEVAMQAVAEQLRPGGTFAAALFGPARFRDAQATGPLGSGSAYQGGRQLLKQKNDGKMDDTHLIRVMARTQDRYNVAPLDQALFTPGAQRINLNMGQGGIRECCLPRRLTEIPKRNYTGPDDVEIDEDEEGWNFETDLAGVKEHFNSFPFISQFPDAFTDLYQELEGLLENGKLVKGYFPVKIILATRR